ncbi:MULTISPECIES: hypothetical protein [unclassified Rhizobium]|uniref:type II toxin-antitoxin system RelE/ParE family toxin n=1 Tax=unclassified Rhizobium TaxID=2613769 RepID=UPI001FDF33CF|nr:MULTISPECIES: hypothetical protein [unclassified Rhizobium]
MAYEVHRHPLVRDDLFNITILIGEYAGYAIAESKIEQIEKKLNSLTDFPHIGTIRDDIPVYAPFLRRKKQSSASRSTNRLRPLTSSASATQARTGGIG